jgi:hypothetical protein
MKQKYRSFPKNRKYLKTKHFQKTIIVNPKKIDKLMHDRASQTYPQST